MSAISSISSAKKCRRTLQNFKTSKVKFHYINGELRSACNCNEIIPPEVRQQNRILGNVYHDMCEQMVEHAKIELYRQIPDPSYPEGTRIEVEFVSNQVCDVKTEDNSPPEVVNLTGSFSPVIVRSINVPEGFDLNEGIVLVPTLVSDKQSNDSTLRVMKLSEGSTNSSDICVRMSYIFRFFALYYDTNSRTWRKLGTMESQLPFPEFTGEFWIKVQNQPYRTDLPTNAYDDYHIARVGFLGPTVCGSRRIDFIDRAEIDKDRTKLSISQSWADNPCGFGSCPYRFPRDLKVKVGFTSLLDSMRIHQRGKLI